MALFRFQFLAPCKLVQYAASRTIHLIIFDARKVRAFVSCCKRERHIPRLLQRVKRAVEPNGPDITPKRRTPMRARSDDKGSP